MDSLGFAIYLIVCAERIAFLLLIKNNSSQRLPYHSLTTTSYLKPVLHLSTMKLATIISALSLTKYTSNLSRHLDSHAHSSNEEHLENVQELFSLYDTHDDGESRVVFYVHLSRAAMLWKVPLTSFIFNFTEKSI